ncbi:MAG TPA: enoyl-CoA hydratase/isomerase family protein [Solirubrobacteraceae bacterium]|jgi:enoyl-CoA hydratase/carnithine racemase|nr:enoyl-CoA hydratase/isomerase family protein [Solirubrobacteraceae bacterium]
MTITTTALGSARVLSWDRQPRRNAWTRAVIEDLAGAIDAEAADPEVGCLVVRGAGEHFSAGDDLFDTAKADRPEWERVVAAFQRLTRSALAAPVPLVAAVDGVCIGGALEFAACCDLRVCTDRARFATPEVRIGLTATNAGTLLLPEVIGETAARELLLTGALRDAEWARASGFVTTVVPAAELDAKLAEVASGFDATSRVAVAETKAMLNQRFGDLLEAALEREEAACVRLFDGEDARAAVQAFVSR